MNYCKYIYSCTSNPKTESEVYVFSPYSSTHCLTVNKGEKNYIIKVRIFYKL